MNSKPTLGYWNVRGRGQPIRNLLGYLNIDFTDLRYNDATGMPEWLRDASSLNLDFPNLPYLIDDELRITESQAIIEYIADKYRPSMLGETLEERAEVRQLGGVISDIRYYLIYICYSKEFENRIEKALVDCGEELKKLEAFIADKEFLMGNKVTWPDFLLLETLEMVEAVKPGKVNELSSKLDEYKKRVAALPGVSEQTNKANIHWLGPAATWRG